MMTKDDINEFRKQLTDMETAARKLKNQNLADVIASAKGKVQQLSEHADLDKVQQFSEHADLDKVQPKPDADKPDTAGPAFDPKAGAATSPVTPVPPPTAA